MKKIVSAAVAATLLAGAAFAEVNTSINFRLGTNVFNNENTSSNKVSYANLGDITATDGFTFKATNDYAGITLNYNPTPKDGGKNLWTSGNGVEFTAYVQPTTWLTLKTGVHKDGISWAEAAKKDTDDTSWSAAGKYAFMYKLGITAVGSTGVYFDSLTDVNGNGGDAGTGFFLADFIFNNVGPGNLLIRATGVKTSKNFLANTKKWPKKTVSVAPGVMVAYNWKDAFKFNFDFQMATSHDIAFGAYVSPLGVADGNLTGVLGFTFSKNLGSNTEQFGYTGAAYGEAFYGIDLRVRYVAGDLHISNAFNFTGATADGIVDQAASIKTKRTGGDFNIWDSLFVTYKLNDKITLTADIQPQILVGDDSIIDLGVTPGLMYTVGKGATITSGLFFTFNDLSDKTDAGRYIGVALPVIFRVKM